MFWSSQGRKYGIYGRFCSITLNKLKSAVTNYSKCMGHAARFHSKWVSSVSVSNNYSKCMRFSYLLELYGLSPCVLTTKISTNLHHATQNLANIASLPVPHFQEGRAGGGGGKLEFKPSSSPATTYYFWHFGNYAGYISVDLPQVVLSLAPGVLDRI